MTSQLPARVIGKYERLCYERHARDLAAAAQPGGHPKGFHFFPERGEYVVQFIERFCKHHKGEWAGKPLILEEWQRQIIRIIFGWMRPDEDRPGEWVRRFRTAYIEIPRKNGKALGLDTPIPTPSGWSTMGELRVGEQVFDERGRPCLITGATPVQWRRPVFRVTFSDGTAILADAEHEWFVTSRRTGLPRTGLGAKSTERQRHIRTTAELRATLWNDERKNEANHRVPVCEPLQRPPAVLPIDPYVLGAWLGDGHSSDGAITQGIKDIEFLRAQFIGAGYEVAQRAAPTLFGVRGLRVQLRALGVLNNKHLPGQYLTASVGQRMELLRGLMDTDGHCSKAGQCEFSTTSYELLSGFLELARSLGFKPSVKHTRAMLRGRDCGPSYRVQFWAFADWPVFRMPRKVARLKPPPPGSCRSRTRQIVAIDPVPSVPVRCIEVDSPSHLYLAGEGMIPTHNSLLASGIGLYLLVADQEPGAEVYSFATKEEQARLLWLEAGKTVRKSERLKKHVKVLADSITYDAAGSFFKPLSSDSETEDGLNPFAGIADELHAHKTRGMWDVIQSGMGSRREPLMLAITTAGTFRPESIGWEKHDYGQKVLDGVFQDDAYFAFICAPDEGDDRFSDLALQKANPNWGISVKPSYLRARAAEARVLPSALNEYLTKHLDIWSQASSTWLSIDKWRACDPSPVPQEEFEKQLEGRECAGGLDLSSKLDLTALVLEFQTDRGRELICRFWLPRARAEAEEERGHMHYAQWAREGWIQLTPGEAIDYDFIKDELKRLVLRFTITELAFDPWGITQLNNDLVKDGVVAIEPGVGKPVLVACPQNFKGLSEATKDFEVSVVKGKLRHNGNPVLTWMANNVMVDTDQSGNVRPNKKKAAGKIDGIVAAIMARSRSIVMPEEEPPQQGGFFVL